MENQKLNPEEQHDFLSWQKSQQRGKITAGILIISFGIIYLLNELGYTIPKWFFSWHIFIIGLGIVVLVKHKFKKFAGWALIGIGLVFTFNCIIPEKINTELIWPSAIILGGLFMILKSRKKSSSAKRCSQMRQHKHFNKNTELLNQLSDEDFIDSVSFFGGLNKNVVSKDFKGADIVTIFGGTELNLIQAEFETSAVIDVSCVFGGVSLIIPSNWQVKSELVSVFGGIEDKRVMNPSEEVESKILILKGNCIFGGIEIKSFK